MSHSDEGLTRGYRAPWEGVKQKVTSPLEEFVHKETGSSMLLMGATIIALILANTPWSEAYHHFLESHITITIGPWALDHSVHHWINDGLMALFFFVVGLEIKREVLVGELSDMRKASLPMIAALGGMVVPAGLYAMVNGSGPGANGWGIPMATDIAFAVGAIMLLGDRIPKSLLTFLLALAIVDDLGAVVVIAIFYTETLNLGALGIAACFLAVLIAFNILGIRRPIPHFIIGFCMWLAMMESGIHATIAGVLGALTVPGRARFKPKDFSTHVRGLLDKFDAADAGNSGIITNDTQRSMVKRIASTVRSVQSPINRWEDMMHVMVAFFVIPLFALANAGVHIAFDRLGDVFSSPVTAGVILGLVIGKPLGIAGATIIAAKLGIGKLPEGVSSMDIVGIGFLGGIGFTMSIFIAELGFRGDPEQLMLAKTGILAASILAGVIGFFWLRASRSKAAPTG